MVRKKRREETPRHKAEGMCCCWNSASLMQSPLTVVSSARCYLHVHSPCCCRLKPIRFFLGSWSYIFMPKSHLPVKMLDDE